MVTVEALACGTPVAGLRNSGTADVVVSERYGQLAEEESTDALADTCRRVLDTSFDTAVLRARADSFSRHRFRRRFSYLLERVVPGGYKG